METFENIVDRQTLTRVLGKNELSFTVKSSDVNYLISWNVPWDKSQTFKVLVCAVPESFSPT